MYISFLKQRTRPAVLGVLAALLLAGCGRESTVDPIVAAKESIKKGDTPSALVILKSALQGSPNNGALRYQLGSALLRVGDVTAAIVELEKAHDAGHSDDDVIPELARAMLEAGHAKKLIEKFADASLTTPSSIASLKSTLATAYWQLDNRVLSKKAIAEALAAVPEHPTAILLQANLRVVEGDVQGAINDTQGILAKDPKNLQAQQFLGVLLLHGSQDVKAAKQAFEKVLEIEPKFADAHKAIILLQIQDKDIAAADAQYLKLKNLLPSHPQTVYMGALLSNIKGDLKTARDLVQKLLRFAPQSAQLQFFAATIEYQLDSMLQAESYLSKGLQSQPDSSFARRLLARVYVNTSQLERALSTISPLLSAGSVEPETLATAAEIHLLMGNIAQAEALYAGAAKLSPENRRARTALAMMKLNRGERESGYAELESLSKTDGDAFADMALVTARMRAKDYEGALRATDALQAKQPTKPFPWLLKARILEAKGDAEGAKNSLEKAIAINPAYLPAAGRLADYDLLAKNPDQAIKRFDAVLKADPKSAAANLAVAEIRRLQGAKPAELAALYESVIRSNPNDARARVLLVNHHSQHGEPKLALDAAQSALAMLPNNPQILNAVGEAQLKAGDLNQALSTFTRLSSQQQKAAYPHFRLAEVHLHAKNQKEALASLSRAVAMQPDYLPAQRAQIAILVKMNDFDAASQIAKRIQQQRKNSYIGHLLEGDVEAARSRWDAAAKSYRLATAGSQSNEAAMKLHQALMSGGKAAAADTFAAEWLKTNKDSKSGARFQMYLGDLALDAGKLPVAEARYRDAVGLDPELAAGWNNLAHAVLSRKGPGALEMAERANALAPGRPMLLDTLASALAADGKFERAVEVQRKAVGLAPDSHVLTLNLAKIYIQAGDKVRAKAELEKLSRVTDSFPGKAQVSKLLAEV